MISDGWDDDWDDFDSFDADFDDDKDKDADVDADGDVGVSSRSIIEINPNAKSSVSSAAISASADLSRGAEQLSMAQSAFDDNDNGDYTEKTLRDVLTRLDSVLDGGRPGGLRSGIALLRESGLGTFSAVDQALLWLSSETQRNHSCAITDESGTESVSIGLPRRVCGRKWSKSSQGEGRRGFIGGSSAGCFAPSTTP